MSIPKIFSDSLASVAESFQGILLDAYGVFWGGNAVGLLPGAKESMEALVSNDKIVGILSNSTQLAAKEVSKWRSHGLEQTRHFHFCLTSGEITRAIFLGESFPFPTPRRQFWVFSGGHPRFDSHEALIQGSVYRETADIDAADFIYLGIPHLNGEDQVDPERFRWQLEAIMAKQLPMVCSNPDRFAHEGNPPRAVVRQGSLAHMYEEMGGEVFYFGKPHEKAYSLAMQYFQLYNVNGRQQVLMVGDTPETDIRGARRFGFQSALVVKAGIMADRIEREGLEPAIQAISLNDTPDYFIDSLKGS